MTYAVAYDEHGTAHEIRSIGYPLGGGPLSVSTTCGLQDQACGSAAILARKGIVTCIECLVHDSEGYDG